MWWSIQSWWEFHRTAVIGLVICVLIAVLTGIVLRVWQGPYGPTEVATGRITGFGNSVGRRSHPIAFVQVDGRRVEIRLPGNPRCRAGSRIALARNHNLIGPTYETASVPNPCGA